MLFRPRSRDDFRVAVICALPLEAQMVQLVFDKVWADKDFDPGRAYIDQNTYTTGVIGNHDVVLVHGWGAGSISAASIVAGLHSNYPKIEAAFMVGVCGVTPQHPITKQEVLLGDCILSTTVIQYDYGRQYPGLSKENTSISDTIGRANTSIRTSIIKMQTSSNLRRLSAKLQRHLAVLQQKEPNLRYPGYQADCLFEESYFHGHHGIVKECDQCGEGDNVCKEECSALKCDVSKLVERDRLKSNRDKNFIVHPQIHFGRYGSSNTVMKSAKHREHLVKENHIVAFEMEGSGVWDSLPTIIVKSACDYADGHKSKSKSWQRYASATAAAGLKAVLEQWRIMDHSQKSYTVPQAMSTGLHVREAVDDVDKLIRNYYHSGGRLLVKRLSGQELDIDKCLINIALTNRSNIASSEKQTSFSLEAPEDNQSISLENLFESKWLNGKTVDPRRIFIHGQAGVGKTTLCKKIVHKFHGGQLWTRLFDRLLWIPLRELKSTHKDYGWQELLQDAFVFTTYKWKAAGEEYIKQLESPKFLGRTLLLLDGLDEIPNQWKEQEEKEEEERIDHFINAIICSLPNIITTSRSQTDMFSSERFDLNVEIVGFTEDQISTYIRNCVKDIEMAAKMENTIACKPLVRGLLRIPIQLDAFCLTWNEKDVTDELSTKNFTTMTTLYQAIIIELCKKELRFLNKADTKQRLPPTQIEAQLKDELALLEGIAFQGLLNNVTEFNPTHWDHLGNHLGSHIYRSSADFVNIFDLRLDRLLFLRTSDYEQEDHMKQTYHFLHLTFQEFFAARHFVEHWHNDKPLTCIQLSGRSKTENKSSILFLQEEKYNPRYNIFWRFVAGLTSHKHETIRFFGHLRDEPVDLLGATHARLLMYCLSEVPVDSSSELRNLYEKEADLLGQGLLKEYQLTSSTKLGSEIEFPEKVLRKFLNSEDELPYEKTLSILRSRSVIEAQTAVALADKMLYDLTLNNRFEVAKTLVQHFAVCSQYIQQRTLSILIAALKDEDSYVRSSAADVLAGQSPLPAAAVDAMIAALKDEDKEVQKSAADALGGQIYAGADLHTRDKDRYTPLHVAVINRDESLVKLLLGIEAKLDTTSERGYTPLHCAVKRARYNIVKLLASAGADLERRSKEGYVALHIAAGAGHFAIVKLLLEFGADVNAKCERRGSALQLALEQAHWSVSKLLIEHGADIDADYSLVSDESQKAIADTMHNIGLLYYNQNKLIEAEKMYIVSLNCYDKSLGPMHVSTLMVVNNLGTLYKNQGKLVEAEEMYMRVLRGYEGKMDHRTSMLKSVNNLGLLYSQQGKSYMAEDMYKRAIRGYLDAFGPMHSSTLDAWSNLGSLYSTQGNLAEAERLFTRVLQGYEEMLGTKHSATLNAVNNLGLVYHKQGNLYEAEQKLSRALHGKQQALGRHHLSTLNTINNLGKLYSDQGRADEAEDLLLEALRGFEEALGAERSGTYIPALNVSWALGDLYFRIRPKIAREWYMKALRGYETVQGKSSRICLAISDRLNQFEAFQAD